MLNSSYRQTTKGERVVASTPYIYCTKCGTPNEIRLEGYIGVGLYNDEREKKESLERKLEDIRTYLIDRWGNQAYEEYLAETEAWIDR